MAPIQEYFPPLLGYLLAPRSKPSLLFFAVLGAIVGFSMSTVMANAGAISSATILLVTIATAVIVGSIPIWHIFGIFALLVTVVFPIYLVQQLLSLTQRLLSLASR